LGPRRCVRRHSRPRTLSPFFPSLESDNLGSLRLGSWPHLPASANRLPSTFFVRDPVFFFPRILTTFSLYRSHTESFVGAAPQFLLFRPFVHVDSTLCLHYVVQSNNPSPSTTRAREKNLRFSSHPYPPSQSGQGKKAPTSYYLGQITAFSPPSV